MILALTLLGLLFAYSLALPAVDRTVAFDRAPESVARVYERRLELASAMEELPAWESAALAPFVPAGAHTTDDAIAAFRLVVEVGHKYREENSPESRAERELQLDGLRARSAVLLAANGRLAEAQGDLDELGRNGHTSFVAAVRALQSGPAPTSELALAGDGWIGKVSAARARGEARPEPGAAVRRALTWARGLAGVVAFGTLVLLAWLGRNRPDVVVGSIQIPSLWTPQTGFGVLVRAAFLGGLVYLGFQTWSAAAKTDVPHYFTYAVASIPLLWLTRRHLARPHRLEIQDVIGFPASATTIALTTLALFAIDRIGGGAVATAASGMGAANPWTFQVDEFVLWSTDAAFAIAAFDRLIFGVFVVLLAFLGILYPSLRHVHGPLHAAVLTGMLFAAVHLASLPTMLALAWSGVVFALAVARTRSLLPALLCASLGGLFETAFTGALYR